jgi:hypothetical protein
LSAACYGSQSTQLIDDPERPGEKIAECSGGSGERHADLVCLAQ